MKEIEDAVKTQAFYYIFESPILCMLRDPNLYDEGLAMRCIEVARSINPSWEFILENEKRFSLRELNLLHQIYSGQKLLPEIAPRYHFVSKLKKSSALKPLKAIYRRMKK